MDQHKNNIVEAHVQKTTFIEVTAYPEHIKRVKASDLIFKKSKKRLDEDGHNCCWICGATENIETHHFAAEWAAENEFDFNALKSVLLALDFYGYSRAMMDVPLTSVDDIRNLLQLCSTHHRGKYEGIHDTTWNSWILQKVCQKNFDPIPVEK